MNDLILFDVQGDTGIITVNNPPVNALSPGVPEGLADGIVKFGADPIVKSIVIIGGGRTFIAGADIKEFGKITSGQKSDIALAEVCLRIEDSPKPVVMAIHGTALGGGLETAMAGHYRVAVASAQVGQPEVKLGIIPGAAGTQRLPRLCGMALALEMCVYGNPISAQKALEAGIVDEIVPGDLREGAIAFARRVAADPPRRTRDRLDKLSDQAANAAAVASARAKLDKRGRSILAERHAITAVEASAEMAFADGVEYERKLFMRCLFSDESKSLIHVFFGERAVAKVPFVPKETTPLPVKSVAVVGAGTMGGGIAMVYANAGIPVLLKETTPEALERA